jgi:hypothetical protein
MVDLGSEREGGAMRQSARPAEAVPARLYFSFPVCWEEVRDDALGPFVEQ